MRSNLRASLALAAMLASPLCAAGGGYFLLGYGPYAHQSGGTSAAIGLDGFSGSSNPAKLSAVQDRLDLDLLVFMPHRQIERSGSGTPYDFSSTSKNEFFLLPEAGYARKLNERWSWGLTLYGNGGLNTEYRDDTGQPGTNANPARCGDRPGNFFMGCGKLGFDLAQVVLAPIAAWQYRPGYSLGIAPLLVGQRIKIYGFQAFEGLSARPDAVTNRGYDYAFGAGLRVGWFGRPKPWLDLGASYATRARMEKFDRYRGLLADAGNFDIPQNFSLGFALRPRPRWEFGADLQRIFFGDIPALANGVLDSVEDPQGRPLGSKRGSGFNWRNRSVYRAALSYEATPALTLRAGYAYGERPAADRSADSVSFGLLAPNPEEQVTAGASYRFARVHEVHIAYGRYLEKEFAGPSATAAFGVGGRESVRPNVDTIMIGWTRRWGQN